MNEAYAYYSMIINGERTINQVPSRIRGEVIELLEQNNQNHLTNSDCILGLDMV